MAKPTFVKCACCKNSIDKSQAFSIIPNGYKKPKYYCSEEEYNQMLSDIENDKKKQLEEKENNKTPRQLLMDRLDELYNHNCPFGMVCSQIKQMEDLYGYKPSGILYTINYMVEMEQIDWKEDNGIGLVKYYYTKAQNYYLQQLAMKKSIQEFNFDEIDTIVVKKDFSKKNTKVKEIDISEL